MGKNLINFFIIVQLFNCWGNLTYAQKIGSFISFNDMPMKNGYVILSDSNIQHGDPSDGVRIFSNSSNADSIFAISDGFVYFVQRKQGNAICGIKSSQYLATYALLSNCKLKIGSHVKRGEYIGRLGLIENSLNFLQLIISSKKGNLSFREHLEILSQLQDASNRSPGSL